MRLAVIVALLGLSVCHVPNIVAGVGPGGMKGMFNRKDADSRSRDDAVIAAYNAKNKNKKRNK